MTRQKRLRTALGTAAAAAGLAALVAGHGALASNRGAGPGVREMAASADKEPPAPAEPAAPGELARQGLAKMLQALEKLIESVPQFQMPEINENGDIILRRKRPDAPVPPAPAPSPDQPDKRAI